MDKIYVQDVAVVAYGNDGVYRESITDNPEHSTVGLLVTFCQYVPFPDRTECRTRAFLYLPDSTGPGGWHVATRIHFDKPRDVVIGRHIELNQHLIPKINEYIARN